MIRYLKTCIKYFAFAGFFSLFINTLHLTFSIYMLAVYDMVLANNALSTLCVVTAIALAALAVEGGLEFLRSRLLVRAGIRLDALLTGPVVREMLRDLSRSDGKAYFDGVKDIQILRNYLGGNAIFAFFDVPWVPIYLGIIYLIHPVLGLTATAGGIINLILGLIQSKSSNKANQTATVLNMKGRQWTEACFRAARELQCMGMIQQAGKGYCTLNNVEMVEKDRADRFSHSLGAISQSFGLFMQVAIYGAGAILVLYNQAGVGVIIAASIIMGKALSPINQGISAWQQTAGAKAAYDNLTRLITQAPEKMLVDRDTLSGGLEVKNLALSIGESEVLKEISFSLEPGESMGLIGPNGAGKTCLCRMLLGMWKPTTGRACLDGNDLFEIDSDSLGGFIGYLPQNVELFSGTVAENIARMGTVDEEAVVAAAKRAGAHDIILRLANGYDTDIGESGFNLSGGQRQRVGLARALYGSPGLVILDEPNANLDEAGDNALMEVLKDLKKKKVTLIMITHKPALLMGVDKILVLEQGRVARFGARDEVFGQMTGDNACAV